MTQRLLYANRNPFRLRLALFTAALAFFVILLGAYTRLTNAGLSCPDWPHCYGFITAPHTESQLQNAQLRYPNAPIDIKRAWTEMTHRYFAGTEAILILILAYLVFFKTQKTRIIGSFLLILLGIQIALGMLTVTEKLKPVIVLSHLITGISILSLLWWAYLELRHKKLQPFNRQLNQYKVWTWSAFFIIAAQIILGGWVSTHYAGLACIDLPYCNGVLLPKLQFANFNSDLITIHMLHRIGAVITASYFICLSLLFLKQAALRRFGFTLFALITMQFILGVLNIIWLRPVPIALMHQATAIVILLTVIAALHKIYFQTRDHGYAYGTA